MTVQSVCLGWHWQPYAYSRTADDTDGRRSSRSVDLVRMAQQAVADTFGAESGAARAGRRDRQPLHGRSPARSAPGLGGAVRRSCCHDQRRRHVPVPRSVDRRTAPFTDIELQSGDPLVFGGPSRRIFHGVPKVHEGTGPRDIGLPPGRLSITIRETVLPASRTARMRT